MPVDILPNDLFILQMLAHDAADASAEQCCLDIKKMFTSVRRSMAQRTRRENERLDNGR